MSLENISKRVSLLEKYIYKNNTSLLTKPSRKDHLTQIKVTLLSDLLKKMDSHICCSDIFPSRRAFIEYLIEKELY